METEERERNKLKQAEDEENKSTLTEVIELEERKESMSRCFSENPRTKWLLLLTVLLYLVLFCFSLIALEFTNETDEDALSQIDNTGIENSELVEEGGIFEPPINEEETLGTHLSLPPYLKIKKKDFPTNKEIYNSEKDNVNMIELSHNLWSRGLFGKMLDQDHDTCKIPIGNFDELELIKPQTYKKCHRPVSHFSKILYKKYVIVSPMCQKLKREIKEEDIKKFNMNLKALCAEEIEKGLYPPKLTFENSISPYSQDHTFVDKVKTPLEITPQHRRSKCPIVYVLKKQHSTTPHYHGTYITQLPLKLNPDEQLITILCGGIMKKLKPTRYGKFQPVAMQSHVRPANVEDYVTPSVQFSVPESISISNLLNEIKPEKKEKVEEKVEEKKDDSTNEAEKKPNVVMFMLDGLSRVHFHRLFSSLLSYLQKNNLNTGYYTFEFFKYHAIDYSSNSNQTPMFFGVDWFQFCKHKWRCNFLKEVPSSRAIWNRAKNVGYQTSFVSQQCWMKFQADWMFNTKGWTNWFGLPLGDLISCYDDLKPICYSGRYSHEYIFDYSRKLWNTKTTAPKFIFHSLLDTHEQSMKVGSILDDSLTSYIHSIQTNHPNTWIILNSDHGIHYGKFYDKRMTGKLEHKLPLLIILAPPSATEIQLQYLQFNQQRLVTHYDLYKFLEEVMGVDVLTSAEMKSLENHETLKEKGSSFISTRFSERRSCKTEDIPHYMCICNKKLNQIPTGSRPCGSGSDKQQC
mmetsp:Transcript_1333/g.1997  ORF Transcript_1333/g.1997 Transcript_1333/m.1997 type:complete len:744 (+) Transcript_1333:17-2248(+)